MHLSTAKSRGKSLPNFKEGVDRSLRALGANDLFMWANYILDKLDIVTQDLSNFAMEGKGEREMEAAAKKIHHEMRKLIDAERDLSRFVKEAESAMSERESGFVSINKGPMEELRSQYNEIAEKVERVHKVYEDNMNRSLAGEGFRGFLDDPDKMKEFFDVLKKDIEGYKIGWRGLLAKLFRSQAVDPQRVRKITQIYLSVDNSSRSAFAEDVIQTKYDAEAKEGERDYDVGEADVGDQSTQPGISGFGV